MYIAGRFSREKHTSQLFFACESRSSLCSLIVQGRVLRALWAVHWSRLATAAGFRLLQNLCAWSGPFLLQQLLGHLQAGAAICKPPVPRNTYQRKLGHSCIAVHVIPTAHPHHRSNCICPVCKCSVLASISTIVHQYSISIQSSSTAYQYRCIVSCTLM